MQSADAPFRAALAQPAIRRVTLGFFAVILGEWVLGTAAAIALFGAHGALAVGLVGARFIPAALASVTIAHLVDHRSPRLVLVGTALTRAAVAGAAIIAVQAGAGMVLIAALVWCDAAAGAAYRPAQARLLPTIARSPAELATTATLASTAKSAGQIVGALVGSVVAALGGAGLGAATALGLFLVAALAAPGGAASSRRRSAALVGLGVRQGYAALRSSPGASRIAFWSCVRSLGRGAWTSLGVLAALVLLHMQETGYGVLMGAAGVGTVIGIALSSRLAARAHLAAPFAAALSAPAVAFLIVGLTAAPAAAFVAMIAWGIGMALSDVSAQALLTRVVPPSESGRVTGFMEGAKLMAEGIGGLAAPVVAEFVGLRGAFIAAAVLLLLALVLDYDGFRGVDRVAVGRVELLDLARAVPWFRTLRVDGLEALVAPMRAEAIAAGSQVITQDAQESRWYLVQRGRFAVYVDGFKTGEVGPGGSFGERGLMRDEPRTATVRAVTDAAVLTLERDDFLRALTGTDHAADAAAPAALPPRELFRRQPILHRLDDTAVAVLAATATERSLPRGATLFSQGDPADDWLVIARGEVEIVVDGEPRRLLGAGDALGEIAVLHDVARTATARAMTDVELQVISGEVLRAAVPMLPDEGQDAPGAEPAPAAAPEPATGSGRG